MNITIRKIEPNDFEIVKKIAAKQLGHDYGEDICFIYPLLVLVAEIEGQVVAFGSADIAGTVDGYTNKDGMLRSVAVDPDFSGKGIASLLVAKRIEMLEELGFDKIVTTAWRSKKGCHMKNILERQGFKKVKEIYNCFEGEQCPDCGDNCKCSAIIFERNKDEI